MAESKLEQEVNKNSFAIASVTADNQFARNLAKECNVQSYIDDLIFNPFVFSGGEFCPKAVPKAIDGKRVYLIANPNPKGSDPQDSGGPQDLFGRILIAADTLKRNGAKEIWLIYTDMHYSRQDRGPHDIKEAEKAKKECKPHKLAGQPFTAMVQAKHFITAGIDKIVTIHPHSEKLYKIYGGALMGIDEYHEAWNDAAKTEEMIAKGKNMVIGLTPAPIVAHYLIHESTMAKKVLPSGKVINDIQPDGSNLVFLDPDAGALPFTQSVMYYTFLPKAWLVRCNKLRKAPNDPSQLEIDILDWPEGLTLEDKYLILVDDGSETGGTLDTAALAARKLKHILNEKIGNPKGVLAYITHPWLNGPYNRLVQQKLAGIKGMQEIIVGNTWTYIEDSRVARFKEISTVIRFMKYVAQAILGFEQGADIEEYFSFNNRQELDEKVPKLYAIKRSESMWHLEEKGKTRPIKINGLIKEAIEKQNKT